jgi:hypothetical protein
MGSFHSIQSKFTPFESRLVKQDDQRSIGDIFQMCKSLGINTQEYLAKNKISNEEFDRIASMSFDKVSKIARDPSLYEKDSLYSDGSFLYNTISLITSEVYMIAILMYYESIRKEKRIQCEALELQKKQELETLEREKWAILYAHNDAILQDLLIRFPRNNELEELPDFSVLCSFLGDD